MDPVDPDPEHWNFLKAQNAAGGSGLCTVLTHSGQHMDELLELGKELGAEAVVLAGTDTARLAAGDRNGGTHLLPHGSCYQCCGSGIQDSVPF